MAGNRAFGDSMASGETALALLEQLKKAFGPGGPRTVPVGSKAAGLLKMLAGPLQHSAFKRRTDVEMPAGWRAGSVTPAWVAVDMNNTKNVTLKKGSPHYDAAVGNVKPALPKGVNLVNYRGNLKKAGYTDEEISELIARFKKKGAL